MGEKNNNTKEKKIILIQSIIIVIIIIFFLLLRSCGKIDNTQHFPTGNVDIFDINLGKDCECDRDSYEIEAVGGSVGNVYVYDDDVVYSSNVRLNIFTQSSYHIVDDKIAPSSENSYQFIIRNNSDFSIKYSLEMIEVNKYNINMRYRLKLNDVYVLGSDSEYVTASQLKQYNINLNSYKYDTYTLDWKWFESSNDTEVGMDINSDYELTLKITASEY